MALAKIDDDNIGNKSISPVTLGLKVAYRKTPNYLDYSLEIDYQSLKKRCLFLKVYKKRW
jgi:hypothetical protein